ncbi:MAG: histidine kinase [Bacteroidetes bacterium]|nr:histidine kinase [Bacteroidota bacterium]
MSKQSKIYWYCQVFGWSFYFFINLIFFGLKYQYDYKYYLVIFLSMPLGIGITHVYRNLILRSDFLKFKIPSQLLLIVVFSVIKAFVFFLCITLLSIWFGFVNVKLSFVRISELIINYSVPFCLWNIIYFGSKYFQNYRRSEINTLRLYVASRESELNNLKAQLNPHFMFNSMNSIRALIDEDPAKAKVAVTKLSNILRTTLLMNKNKLIPLREEIKLVKEYLDLEQIRYEERLSYNFKIDENVQGMMIPPFIIQAQVENAVKHGISKLPGNGMITIEAFSLADVLKIKVSNTGKISSEKPLTGVGFVNSIQRLELLYGTAGKIFISEVNNLVVVDINIPLK